MFDKYRQYANHYPIDDQRNFHYPIAQLTALMKNVNRGQGERSVNYNDFLMFKPAPDIDELLLSGDW